MSIPVAPPTNTQSPVVTSTVRTITPIVVAAIVYALTKANIHLDNNTVNIFVSGIVSSVVAGAYTYVVRWLETFKSSKWGKLFIIAKTPTYASTPAPAPVVTTASSDGTSASTPVVSTNP
jgi:hypothetical protein